MISEEKKRIVIGNYFNVECDVNTTIREAYERGFDRGMQKVSPVIRRDVLKQVLEIIDELKRMEDGLEERANSIGFVNHTPTGNVKAVEHLVTPRNPNEIKVVKLNAKADGIQYAREYLKSAVLALKGEQQS